MDYEIGVARERLGWAKVTPRQREVRPAWRDVGERGPRHREVSAQPGDHGAHDACPDDVNYCRHCRGIPGRVECGFHVRGQDCAGGDQAGGQRHNGSGAVEHVAGLVRIEAEDLATRRSTGPARPRRRCRSRTSPGTGRRPAGMGHASATIGSAAPCPAPPALPCHGSRPTTASSPALGPRAGPSDARHGFRPPGATTSRPAPRYTSLTRADLYAQHPREHVVVQNEMVPSVRHRHAVPATARGAAPAWRGRTTSLLPASRSGRPGSAAGTGRTRSSGYPGATRTPSATRDRHQHEQNIEGAVGEQRCYPLPGPQVRGHRRHQRIELPPAEAARISAPARRTICAAGRAGTCCRGRSPARPSHTNAEHADHEGGHQQCRALAGQPQLVAVL